MIYKVLSKIAIVTATLLAGLGCQQTSEPGLTSSTDASSITQIPTFRVDVDWPQVPSQWKLGHVSSIAIDADDNAWILHRTHLLTGTDAALAAPAVLGFDPDGQFIDAWGGETDNYDWPQRNHGIHIDYQGHVWLGGNNCPARNEPGLEPINDDQLLKFTLGGEFVMQIGESNASGGNSDTQNLHGPAASFVHPPTNEIFVADGYGNHRVIVFDAETGHFKRMWGAFGNVPVDKDDCPNLAFDSVAPGPGPDQFVVVHALRVSNDGLVYVADRENRRLQIFTIEGQYVDQIIRPEEQFARNVALSPDSDQQFLYIGGGDGIMVYSRETLEYLTTISGDGVIGYGHQIETDSRGNIYIAQNARGFQRLLFTGMVSRDSGGVGRQ